MRLPSGFPAGVSGSLGRNRSVPRRGPRSNASGTSRARLGLGEKQVVLNQVVQRQDFIFGQEVPGDADIGLVDPGAPPRSQAHVRLPGIGAGVNDLGGGLAGNRPVHRVLDRLEEADAFVRGRIVVDAGGVDIGDLLVEAPLRAPGSGYPGSGA